MTYALSDSLRYEMLHLIASWPIFTSCLHLIIYDCINVLITFAFERYTILAVTLLLAVLSFWTVSSRSAPEGFAAAWSTLMLVGIAVGGTMVMRKFYSSFYTGLFIGALVATAQYYFLLSLIYGGYSYDREAANLNGAEDTIQCIVSAVQGVLLASFALFLTSHRGEIDKDDNASQVEDGSLQSYDDDYDPPALS